MVASRWVKFSFPRVRRQILINEYSSNNMDILQNTTYTLYVYIYIYMCMYIFMYVYEYIYIYVYVCARVFLYTRFICNLYVNTYLYNYIYIYILNDIECKWTLILHPENNTSMLKIPSFVKWRTKCLCSPQIFGDVSRHLGATMPVEPQNNEKVTVLGSRPPNLF